MTAQAYDLGNALDAVLRLDPDAPAVHFGDTWVTWGGLRRTGDALNAAIDRAGVPSTDGVAVLLRNRPEMIGAVLGILRSPRYVLSVSPMLPDGALAADLTDLRPAVVVAAAEDWVRPGFRDAVARVGALALEVGGGADAVRALIGLDHDPGHDHHQSAPDAAVTMLSSGTTGSPKRVVLSRQQLVQTVLTTGAHHGVPPDALAAPKLRPGVSMIELPLFHIAAMFNLVSTVLNGRQLCVAERFEPWSWARSVREHQMATASTVPTGLRMILDAGVPKEWLASLKVVRTGSAPLDPALAAEFHDRYGVPVLQAYGATETGGAVSSMTTADLRRHGMAKLTSVGRPHPGVELAIVDPGDNDRVLGPDEVGVLLIRSAQLASDEWVRTNDLARIDADGFLYIIGRADDVIIRGGFKIDIAELQSVLAAHPAVTEAAVVDLPDARLGQVPAAVVVLQGSLPDVPTPDELKAWLRARVAAYKVPSVIRVVDALPRTTSMKVSRPGVRQLLTAAD